MELRDIKKIVEMITQHELTEFELQDEDFRLSIKRGRGGSDAPVMVQPAAPAAPAAPVAAQDQPAMDVVVPDENNGWLDIKSPIVGTFYRSPTPDSDAYASVGQEVDEDTVVCIIEAMKVMNEIKAEVKGVIKKVLVENATPVEYDQPLFAIDPT